MAERKTNTIGRGTIIMPIRTRREWKKDTQKWNIRFANQRNIVSVRSRSWSPDFLGGGRKLTRRRRRKKLRRKRKNSLRLNPRRTGFNSNAEVRITFWTVLACANQKRGSEKGRKIQQPKKETKTTSFIVEHERYNRLTLSCARSLATDFRVTSATLSISSSRTKSKANIKSSWLMVRIDTPPFRSST